ncbi:MAG: enoyl-CoA hydratase/isomerase family protein [Candidatus Methylomirabilis oxyfera]|nr:enoyl-CoA hydratase/isomerase family protein [Candidatus Methylomirabilis oxyfera]
MNDRPLLIDREDQTAIVTINRHAQRNSLSFEMWEAFPGYIKELDSDPSVRVIVLTGAGDKAFASGADISEFTSKRTGRDAAALYHRVVEETMSSIEKAGKPVIAMVNGFALGGGCELAIACDLRIASESASFGIPSARLGVVISFSDTKRLVDLVGAAVAKEMLMTGRRLSAREALAVGLVNQVVPDESLRQATLNMAAKIAANAPFSVASAKAMVDHCCHDADLSSVGSAEADRPLRCYETEDFREGVHAFLEKRPPRFTGQ